MNYEQILTDEAKRLVTALTQADPLSSEYGYGLSNFEHLLGIKQFAVEALGSEEAKAPTLQIVDLHPVEDPFPAPEESTKPQTETESPFTKEQVRAALAKARKDKGINVTELLKEFGVDNFPAFPEGRYAELMERLQ